MKRQGPSACVRPLRAVMLASLVGAAGLTGCDRNTLKKVEDSESILGFIPTPPSPAEAARWSQDPYDADKRFRGTNLLANAPFGGEDVYVQTYRMKLGAPPADGPDPDAGVRGVAARALSLHGQGADAALIIPLLKDQDRRVRLEGVRALQRLHNPAAIDPLITAMDAKKEDDYDVRAEAATALGQYAEPRVLQSLVAALDDDMLAVSRSARSSLATLTGQDFGEDQRQWVAWLRTTKTPFEGRREYIYPVFNRDRYWFEYVPLVPQPPNEIAAAPVGMGPPVVTQTSATPAAPAPTSTSTSTSTSTPATATATEVKPAPAPTAPPVATSSAPVTPSPGATPAAASAPPAATTAPVSSTSATPAPAPASVAPTTPGPQPRPEPLPPMPSAGPAPAQPPAQPPTQPPPAPPTPAPSPAPAPAPSPQPAPPASNPPASGGGFVPGTPVTPAPKKP